eukprot:CAMPEP_0114547306 /NCGR_PEP_ID=MMETSP0114-20121206/4395_1 /TAXON_ID=31324 /ORGANISM="Goniomonas sp, Strain m" /LENGTH=261 /DNA_ID=CAMNT_0001731855 /DNA_START=1 /DNA_END=786 /DNA_ORIENTATION=-
MRRVLRLAARAQSVASQLTVPRAAGARPRIVQGSIPHLALRAMSTEAVPTLTADAAVRSQVAVLNTLKSDAMRAQLEGIKNSGADLITKWQSMLGVVLPLQIHSIVMLGYSGDQQGLSKFSSDLFQLMQSGEHELRACNDEKWTYLLDVTFGVPPGKKMTVHEARSVAADISASMQSAEFLNKVDATVAELPSDASTTAKRQHLLTILLPLHMEVLGKHGYPGEAGYVQAQLALMEHMNDQPVIMSVMAATTAVFNRAGIN